MPRKPLKFFRLAICGWLVVGSCLAHAQRIRLKDGRMLEGRIASTSGVADNPNQPGQQAGQVRVTPILIVDDQLRRTFVPKFRVDSILDSAPKLQVKISIWQNVDRSGSGVASVGPSLGITPFDQFGRRIYTMRTERGPLSVVQGITELTPRYAKVEGLQGAPGSVVWDMRLATSSMPRDMLSKILVQAVPQDDPQARLEIVKFYLQAERYSDARRELEQILQKFPELKELSAQVRQLRQMGARRILKEIELRKSAGQHELVQTLLENFPTNEVEGETLQQVREIIAQYDRAGRRIAHIRKFLQATVDHISDATRRQIVQPIVTEISQQLSYNNAERLTPFAQLLDDDALSADHKAAIAVSGWLLGANDATENLAVAVSLVQVRDVVKKYLREPLAHRRSELLDSIHSLEGASVEYVAKIVAQMAPPWDIEPQTSKGFRYHEMIAPGQSDAGDFRYLVQLPPEYDPYRRYPTLVTLNGAYNTPQQELDFWAGMQPIQIRNEELEIPNSVVTGPRNGQAMRHGFITLAIEWLQPHQYEYGFSAREHAAVLTCLRDAYRRLSVDTDQVFLTGHSIGGAAAWDIAQSHPDLWAGAMPISARSGKYDKFYWENGQFVPFYFVSGELDGQVMSQNASLLNMYLKRRYDTTVVEYLGRGHEPFHDEIQHLFDWMGRKRRGNAPSKFECKTMRPWDNFYWWIECDNFPDKWMMYPQAWDKRKAKPTVVSGRQPAANRLLARTASESTTLWLSPELVDFSKPIRVTLNGKKLTSPQRPVRPELKVLLEDVRTRADRQHPFWAKIESP